MREKVKVFIIERRIPYREKDPIDRINSPVMGACDRNPLQPSDDRKQAKGL